MGADVGTGPAQGTHSTHLKAHEGLQLQGQDGQVVMETKLLAFLWCLEF